jgi:ribulose-5-phosphate 4-epimerase/fuculose-1-phosphate aldolase
VAAQLKRDLKCSEAEWAARQDLAAAYRIFDMLGWGESIYNHITLRVPGEEAFLINPFGLLWSEVTASNLIKIDPEGNKLCGSPYPVNLAGFTQHAVFRIRRTRWRYARARRV